MEVHWRIGVVLAFVFLSTACVGGWVMEDSPSGEDLYAVWGATGTDVFAVGAKGTVLRRQNAKWRQLDSGVEEDLYGVWGTGTEHVVIVGDNCTALEFNGEPEPPEDGGVAPPDLRPLQAATCSNFRGIDGSNAGSAFVVGEGRSQWYDGSRLTDGRTFDGRMLGVSLPPSGDIFAAGEGGSFWHKQGDNWNEQVISICDVALVDGECPDEHTMHPVLWDVWVGDAGQGAIVGTFGGMWLYPPPEGSAWQSVDTGFSNEIRAVHGWVNPEAAKNQTTYYAVGMYGVVVRLNGNKLIREALGTNEHLYGVWVSGDGGHVYTVGAGGTIVHYTK
jgi:hypothetical protein